MNERVTAVSGMRISGNIHAGNYFGAMTQFLQLQAEGARCFFFVADLHAYTKARRPIDVYRMATEVARLYIACGVDPTLCTLYRQSDVPEISQISVLLATVINLGRLSRCVTFKEELRKAEMNEGEASLALVSYPVLMSADIVSVRANRVPVGRDQAQHIEITRSIAAAFNRIYIDEVLVVPEMHMHDSITVPGLNGSEKMGKSDGNTLGLLDDERSIRKKIGCIPTQTNASTEMTSGTQALFTLVDLCCPQEVAYRYRARFADGESGFFGEMKQRLGDDVVELLKPIQRRYAELSDDSVAQILADGAGRVRSIAGEVLVRMQIAMGIRPNV